MEQTEPRAVGTRLILIQPEERGAPSDLRRRLPPIKVPQQRLAARAGFGVLLRAPEGPERGPIPLDAFVVGHERLERGEDLQAPVSLQVPMISEQGQKIPAPGDSARFQVLFMRVRIQEKQNARAIAVEGRRMDGLSLVNRPEIKLAFQGGTVGAIEQRPEAVDGLVLAPGEGEERPRTVPFPIRLFLPVL